MKKIGLLDEWFHILTQKQLELKEMKKIQELHSLLIIVGNSIDTKTMVIKN